MLLLRVAALDQIGVGVGCLGDWGGLLLGFRGWVGCCWGFVGGGWLWVCGDGEWWAAVRVIRRRERNKKGREKSINK